MLINVLYVKINISAHFHHPENKTYVKVDCKIKFKKERLKQHIKTTVLNGCIFGLEIYVNYRQIIFVSIHSKYCL